MHLKQSIKLWMYKNENDVSKLKLYIKRFTLILETDKINTFSQNCLP